MTYWADKMPRTHREVHFSGRLVRCFADRPRSVDALLQAAVARNGEGEAVVCGPNRLTWRELERAVVRLASGLARKGVGKGDRIALLMGNCAEFVACWLAACRIGAISVPINVREPAAAVEYLLRDCGAKLVIHDSQSASRLPHQSALPGLLFRVCLEQSPGSESISELFDPVNEQPAAKVDEEDTTCILYTSGTTGEPKGAMLCHMNIIHSAMHYACAMGLGKDDRSLIAVPMSHVTGLVAQVATMAYCAGASVIMENFRASEFIAVARSERITHSILVPAMYELCTRDPNFGLLRGASSWRIAGYGGAPMPKSTLEKFSAGVPQVALMNCYGASETSSPATIMPSSARGYEGSVGQAVACADVIVMNNRGAEVAAGETGEVWIGGPMVVKGYWNKPEATARAFTGGFWRSGDLGTVDADGFVYVLDRIKDVINRGGYKIFSAEVEYALLHCPGVVECAVVPIPCPVLGERVHAFVTSTDSHLTAAILRELCCRQLADYKVPETFTIDSTPLPRNANGKLLKRQLRERLLSKNEAPPC